MGKSLACHCCDPGSIFGVCILQGSGRPSKVDLFHVRRVARARVRVGVGLGLG